VVKEIVWQDLAKENFESIQDHILAKWGENAANKFTNRVFNFIEILERFPFIGSVENSHAGIRGFTIAYQTRVLYKVTEETIFLLAFYDLRQDPENKSKIIGG
jgi:plasmid stabilization system protein ParE